MWLNFFFVRFSRPTFTDQGPTRMGGVCLPSFLGRLWQKSDSVFKISYAHNFCQNFITIRRCSLLRGCAWPPGTGNSCGTCTFGTAPTSYLKKKRALRCSYTQKQSTRRFIHTNKQYKRTLRPFTTVAFWANFPAVVFCVVKKSTLRNSKFNRVFLILDSARFLFLLVLVTKFSY